MLAYPYIIRGRTFQLLNHKLFNCLQTPIGKIRPRCTNLIHHSASYFSLGSDIHNIPKEKPPIQARDQPMKNLFELYKDPESRGNNILYISLWNVNGIRAISKKKALQSYFEAFKPDIIGLNEIRIDDETLTKESTSMLSWLPSHYFCYFNCSKAKKGYAGTGLITRFEPRSVTFGIDENLKDDEGRVITAEFEEFMLVVCYVPNAGSELYRLRYRVKQWDLAFRNYLNELAKRKKVVVIGDFNVAYKEIDIHDPKRNEGTAGYTIEERESFGKLLNEGYVDTFRHLYPQARKYSWFSSRALAREKNRGWRIDYCLVSNETIGNVLDSSINQNILGSDHCPVEVLYKIGTSEEEMKDKE